VLSPYWGSEKIVTSCVIQSCMRDPDDD
jgi:hypothetical protein